MTAWQKMSPEQQAAQKERGKIWRWKKRAKELGITFEEYSLTRGRKVKPSQKKVKEPVQDEEEFFVPVNLIQEPEEKIVQSILRPWISFRMRKHIFENPKFGEFIGYKTVEIIKDSLLQKEYEKRARSEV